jgi:hypothetical protein
VKNKLKYSVSTKTYSDTKYNKKNVGASQKKQWFGKNHPIANFLVQKNLETPCLISVFHSVIP